MVRIVIIEDDGALRNDICDRLERWGFEVVQASTGEQGLAAIEKHRPHLVLSDICMPEENGFQLVQRVRRLPTTQADTPFLFMSAASIDHAKTYGHHCGADDYITKPIDYQQLKSKIEVQLNKKSGLMASVVNLLRMTPVVARSSRSSSRSLLPRAFGRR